MGVGIAQDVISQVVSILVVSTIEFAETVIIDDDKFIPVARGRRLGGV